MNPRPDGRPTLAEMQAARRREVAARRREMKAEAAARRPDAPPRRTRLRPSYYAPDGPPPPPRKSDAEYLRQEAAVRAALTPDEIALLDALHATYRRRVDLQLRPEPGATPPALPGTPEERAALREKIAAVPIPDPRAARGDRLVTKRAARREANREAHADFEDLDALPADEGVVQRSWAANAGAAEERRIDREMEELI